MSFPWTVATTPHCLFEVERGWFVPLPIKGYAPVPDRGTQFASAEWQILMGVHNIICNKSNVGHCGDNGVAEGASVFLNMMCNHRIRKTSLGVRLVFLTVVTRQCRNSDDTRWEIFRPAAS